MRFFSLSLFLFFLSLKAFAGPCCIASGPRSFVQLKHLQSYDLGIATSIKDTFGKFNPYGQLVNSRDSQVYTVALGGAFRLTPRTEIYGLLPFATKKIETGTETRGGTSLGDIAVGIKAEAYDAILDDEWLPNVRLLMALKMPTGSTDSVGTDGSIVPGTGSGNWEPSLGIQLQRDMGIVIGTVSGTYSYRFSKTVKGINNTDLNVKEGDRFELMESATLPLTQMWSITGGSTQAWDLGASINGTGVADSHGRMISGFLSSSYFLTRFWTLTVGFESSLPIDKMSQNEDAYRTVTFSSTYAIY